MPGLIVVFGIELKENFTVEKTQEYGLIMKQVKFGANRGWLDFENMQYKDKKWCSYLAGGWCGLV